MLKALEINNLHKTYRNGNRALSGVNLEVNPGDFYALLGPNGAGKSTTIGIICSLINKTSGKVRVYGVDLDSDPAAARMHIGLVPQEFNFNIFEPVGEILINQAGYYGIPRKLARERAEIYLNKLELWDRRYDMARELSGGMKRRLMIARALVHEPRLLILDEPTAGVDIEIRHAMWNFMRELNANGTTIILTTHYLEEAESLCNNIAIIDQGVTIEQTNMRSLLDRLHMETFVLYLDNEVDVLPDCGDYHARLLDKSTMEVDKLKGQDLNDLYARLSACGLQVVSMRNKSNRLEQLFISMLNNNGNR
ncbi:MAG: ABC transporter ATP-binding protein [Thiotrichales bacterium]|nr:MAG: ABC transporter ATP-binding protein [Thiotrichales bacterium]